MVIVSRQPAQLASGISVKRLSAHRLLPIAVSVVLLLGMVVYRHIFTPEQKLRAELSAYLRSVAEEVPRPDRIRHLSSNSVPILLKWMRQTEPESSFSDRAMELLRRVTFHKIEFGSVSVLDNYPPVLAFIAFDFLGTNAANAVPELRQLVLNPEPALEPAFALQALVAIGEPSLTAAADFCRSSEPQIRSLGAQLIGSVGKQRERSVAMLLPLLDDSSPSVSSEAYAALSEFPGAESEKILLPKLRQISGNEGPLHFTAAYALHTGSTNALLHLIEACIESTNSEVRASLLAALAVRDEVPSGNDYMLRRDQYTTKLETFTLFNENETLEDELLLIRSNILATGLPHVEKVLATTNSFTGRPPQNPLQSPR